MFCNNCGKKIKAGAARCSCGAPVEQMEYCGGFWGLVGKKPEKARRNDLGENQNKQPPVERAVLSSGQMGSENTERSFESGERRSRSSGGGIGLVIGGIVAALVLIVGGALLFMRKGNPEPSTRTVAEENTRDLGETEYTEENAEVSKGQLEEQYKNVKDRIKELEEKEKLLEDPNRPNLEGEDKEKNDKNWEEFEELLGEEDSENSIIREFDQLKSDYLSYANQDLSFNETQIDKLDKTLHLAQLDLKVHEEFPSISRSDDSNGYQWGNDKDDSVNANTAKEIINEYEKLQPEGSEEISGPKESYLNNKPFASGLSLTRMEALLYDYCIDYYKKLLGENLSSAKDYQEAKEKDDPEFEGDHDNLWYAEWCINDLEENGKDAVEYLNNKPEDVESIKKLRDSDAGKDQEKDSSLTEDPTQESTTADASTQETTTTEDINMKNRNRDDRSHDTVKNGPRFPFKR